MFEEKTYQALNVIQSKMDEYYNAVTTYVNGLRNDPSQILRDGDVQALIEQTLEFIRDNEVMLTPDSFKAGTRFSSSSYNDFIDAAKIDFEVTYARLRLLTKTINTVSNIIDAGIYEKLSIVDRLLDRIYNLSQLRNTYSKFDDVYSNTFIEDNNDFLDIGHKAKHNESGGTFTLRTISSDSIVEREENFNLYTIPLNSDAILHTHNTKPTSSRRYNGMDVSLYSKTPLFVNDYQIGFFEYTVIDPDTGAPYYPVSSVSYNGGTLAVILQFPSVKFINHVAMKFASAGLTDVLAVYYSREFASNLYEFQWNVVDFNVDKNNIRGVDINFTSKEAGAVLIILGQKKTQEKYIKATSTLSSLITSNTFDIAKLNEALASKSHLVTKNKLKEYVSSDVVKQLSDETARLLNTIIQELESLLPETTPEVTPEQITVLEYNFSIFDLEVNYHHYYTSSVFKSEPVGGDGSIFSIALTTSINELSIDDTDDISLDTSILFYIELENGQHRIIPYGDEYIKDIITIEEESDGIDITLEQLANSSDIQVYINGKETTFFSTIKQFATSTVVLGVRISSSVKLNFGDLIVITYKPSPLTTDDKINNVYELNMDNIIGNPMLVNDKFINGKMGRALLKLSNDEYMSLGVPEDIHQIKIAASGVTGVPDEYIYGYRLTASGISKIDSGLIPVDAISGVENTKFIPEHNVKIGSKTIYYGVLDEIITPVSGVTTYNTTVDYLPGSLHAFIGNQPININEYDLDSSSSSLNDKTIFDTNGIEYTDKILIAYIPIDPTSELIVSQTNVSAYNYSEVFTGTSEDGTITVPYYPHVDFNIRKIATVPSSEWRQSKGKFVNRYNEEIVYEPIRIIINGKIIENKTDYLTGEIPFLDVFRPGDANYQYYVFKNKIVFNTIITGITISVSFYKQNDRTRLVSKLYRTNRKIDDITPEIYGYSIYINKRD